jgi:hypothetical protein
LEPWRGARGLWLGTLAARVKIADHKLLLLVGKSSSYIVYQYHHSLQIKTATPSNQIK